MGAMLLSPEAAAAASVVPAAASAALAAASAARAAEAGNRPPAMHIAAPATPSATGQGKDLSMDYSAMNRSIEPPAVARGRHPSRNVSSDLRRAAVARRWSVDAYDAVAGFGSRKKRGRANGRAAAAGGYRVDDLC